MRTFLLILLLAGCAQPPAQLTPVDRSTQASTSESVAAFGAWLKQWADTPQGARRELEREGARLAAARRSEFQAMLTSDPQQALAHAVTPLERLALPAAITEHLEVWRDGVGSVHVIAVVPVEDGETKEETERFVTFDDAPGEFLRAGLFGQRALEATRTQVRLHGVALDGAIAVTDSRLRLLQPGEPRRALRLQPPRTCPVSNELVDPDLVYDGADALFGFCSKEHADQWDNALAKSELEAAAARNEPPSSTWTEGPKKVLLIRVDFSDRPGDPVSLSSANALLNTTVKNYYSAASFGKVALTGTVTPTIRLPRTQANYQSNQDYVGLMSDAYAAAKLAGFDQATYDFPIVGFVGTFSGGWAGRGYVGSKGTWLNGYFDLRVTGHELGHNFGLRHANYWAANGLTIIGPGTNVEYGNVFDMMGSSGGTVSHFNAWYKRVFDWVPSSEVAVVSTSGTYRISALEQPITSGLHGLKVRRDAQKDYWVEFRNAFSNTYLQNGASINWGYAFAGTASHLLDMTPGDNDRNNSALVIGRTFSDSLVGIHLTPVGKAGSTPEALDVVVNLGTYPGNRPPTVSLSASSTTPATNQAVTLNATASDPDGDTLAYAWTFDDGTFGPNASTTTKSFATARAYAVRLVVSDMKGQTASAVLLVTVGTPATFTLRGQVLVAGQPLEGVRISNGTRVTYSATDGRYALTNVPAGSFTLSAAKTDYAFTAGFTQPVVVVASGAPDGGAGDGGTNDGGMGDGGTGDGGTGDGGMGDGGTSDGGMDDGGVPDGGSGGSSLVGLDFTATPVTFSIAGKVQVGVTGVAGVLVTDGSRAVLTNSNGDYALSPVPTGRYTLTATKVGWSFGPSFTNPVEVLGGAVGGMNFSPTGASLSGAIIGAGITVAPVVTDGVRTVTATTGQPGTWYWSMSGLPNGSWNVVATSPGVSLVPSFANPIVTTGAYRGGLDFTVSATAGVNVAGRITTGGTPLPGVSVTDGTRTSTSDGLGRYVLVAVPPGTYTLTPTLTGNTFIPVTRTLTVAGVAPASQDFTTTVVNLPPTVVSAATATPNPVTTGTTAQLAVLGADDSGQAALTYTWSLPPNGWPLSFSANGTNAAKNTTVTFTGTGNYPLECIISDPGGLSVRSQVVVQVQQLATGLTISPATASVSVGGSRSFSANLLDQFGRNMYTGSPTWVLSGGGTLLPQGWNATFTAGTTPGGPYTLTGTVAGRSASATITVTAATAPVITTPASATPTPVTGTTTAVSVRATDDGGEPALTYTWSQQAGPAGVTFSVNGTNAAKDSVATFTQAGDYLLSVAVTDAQAHTTTNSVSVLVSATPTTIDVQPSIASLQVSASLQFAATVTDQFGDSLARQPTLAWALAGGGTVNASGLVTAGAVAGGPFLLTVTSPGFSIQGTAQVTVGAAPDAEPPTVTLITPVAGARVMGLATLEATASDAVGVTKVEFYLDATTKLGEVTAAPWTLQADFAAVANGSHTLTAKAFDAAGNSATSDGVVVTVGSGPVDLLPPVVALLRPVTGETTGLVVAVEVDATDDVGVTRVELELDGAMAQALVSAPWAATLTVGEGSHTLVAVAFDASGKFTRSAAVVFIAGSPDGGSTTADGGGSGSDDAGSSGEDAGSVAEDAGSVAEDAGVSAPDAGGEPALLGLEPQQAIVGSCGCAGVDGSELSLLSLGLLGLARRRRRGARGVAPVSA
jgi:hypothetical protein